MLDDLSLPELSPAQFHRISSLMQEASGVALHAGKENLVRSRLLKRLRALGLHGFDAYLKYLDADQTGQELTTLIDVLTTNKTEFFRESEHIDYLRQRVLPRLRGEGVPIRIWSAGCSSGEEPYSLAIALREEIPDVDLRDARILATDISTRVLARARAATYDHEQLDGVPPDLLDRYFEPEREGLRRVRPAVQRLVSFARLNLLGPWPMRGPFDAIFCRNVMIYFEHETRDELVGRFWELLRPGGHLFLGTSESLTGSSHAFRYVQPAVYVK